MKPFVQLNVALHFNDHSQLFPTTNKSFQFYSSVFTHHKTNHFNFQRWLLEAWTKLKQKLKANVNAEIPALSFSELLRHRNFTLDSSAFQRGFLDGAAGRVFCQTVPRTVIASIVAVRCFVEVISLNFLLPELYLKKT